MPHIQLHNMQKSVTSSVVFIILFIVAFFANASEVASGDLRAAIRSAGFSCHQVINVKSAGDNDWVVKCNAGKYRVKRDPNGQFTVSQVE
ncbi:hypothetical protein [Corallincola spongiicola]|uniref:PepSY domain-containing protein n=1 Tax=Corallincola spongiicola TaxID=2520508 RepID=A0ABY1WRW0_9GAMM|nr:hypothetical protein [Corallincola spongiicola]TAA47313.1 hypothetical protein EXY25_08755 [Corallincola spongiicola]